MGKTGKIVVGYDGSESAGRALDRAAELSGYGTQLTVVSVARDSNGFEQIRRLLSEASERLLRLRTFAQLDERVGDPAEQLIAAVGERGADLLIVGNGKTALQRLLLGSVSTKLVHDAPCDVLVTR
jgi:nucleotide-binding universal stress UspA family protein